MSLASMVDAMVAAGCSPEQIAKVVRAHEDVASAKLAARRERDAARKRRSRMQPSSEMSRNVRVTKRDNLAQPPTAPSDPTIALELSATSAKAKPAKAPKSRGTRLPADWWPDDDLREFARQHLPDGRTCQDVTARFKDWAASSPKAVKLDWPATYRNFVRNNAPKSATLFGDQNRPGFAGRMPSTQPQRMSLSEGLRQVMEMIPDDE